MRIKRMKATFGRLEGAELRLEDGLNLLEAPNESGKSTWCAFLRAMLYGVPTKERDRVGYLAEKNRYQPWSGANMEGELELTWNGRALTLRRFPKGAAPFGGFEAVYTGTGEPVPGLTADNAGEVLLGVPREVFERSSFVGQSAVPVDGNPELEKRIAALVSSGEEDVSYSQTERRLRDWLNRRRHNKSGLIPKLEGEVQELDTALARLDRVGRALAEAQGERDALRAKEEELSAEFAAQRARQDRTRREEYDKAVAYLSQCRGEVAALQKESGPLPEKETLRAAQGDLAYYNTLGANLKMAENDLARAQDEARSAAESASDPVFSGLTAGAARDRAAADRERLERKSRRWGAVAVLGLSIAAAVALVWFHLEVWLLLPGAACLSAFVLELLALGRERRERERVLAAYGAQSPEELTQRAEAFAQRQIAAEAAESRAEAVAGSLRQMTAQREELFARLLGLVGPFAPTVTDVFGISAAISKALSLDERLSTARARLEGAQRLVSSIPAPTGVAEEVPESAPLSDRTAQQTAAMLSAVRGELQRAESALAMAAGERNTLGDPVALESRRSAAAEELARRGEEYAALSLALEVLGEANADLQERFSPALSHKAGEYFSALTGGKYADVTLTRDFEALAREEGAVLPRRSLSLSRGTVDQLYLAVRLAVCTLALPEGESAPLILDDALSDFDDARMALALELLRTLGETRQILLFTCHSREKTWLDLHSGI